MNCKVFRACTASTAITNWKTLKRLSEGVKSEGNTTHCAMANMLRYTDIFFVSTSSTPFFASKASVALFTRARSSASTARSMVVWMRTVNIYSRHASDSGSNWICRSKYASPRRILGRTLLQNPCAGASGTVGNGGYPMLVGSWNVSRFDMGDF